MSRGHSPPAPAALLPPFIDLDSEGGPCCGVPSSLVPFRGAGLSTFPFRGRGELEQPSRPVPPSAIPGSNKHFLTLRVERRAPLSVPNQGSLLRARPNPIPATPGWPSLALGFLPSVCSP